ncbi:MAG: alkaline phosphatase family protein [Candidatus Nanoarchaeia archaeon]
MVKPDYKGGSIVNLMSSIEKSFSGKPKYPELRGFKLRGKKIILIVIDGLGYDYLKANKNSFLYKKLKDKITSVFPSTTASAITTFSTGLAPKQHAMTGWFVNLKEVGAVSAVLPFIPRIGGVTYSDVGVAKTKIFDSTSFSKKVQNYCAVVPSELKITDFSRSYSENFLGYNSLNGFIRQIKKASCKSFVYAYWPVFDKLSHKYGIASKQTKDHFKELDHALSKLRGLNAQVILTADHGFTDVKKIINLNNHPKLMDCLSLPLAGEARAAYCYVYPTKAKEFESYVKNHLSKYAWLYTREKLMKENWYGLYKPHKKLFHRVGDYVLLMKKGYALRDYLPNEEEAKDIGFHGGISAQEMHVPLVLW